MLGGITRRDFDGDPAAAEVVPPADLIAAEWRVALRRVGAVFFSAKKLALAAGGDLDRGDESPNHEADGCNVGAGSH